MNETLEVLVNPFESKSEFESPDNIKKVDAEVDENVRIALEKYDEALKEYNRQLNLPTFNALPITAGQKVPPLTPAQLDYVLQRIQASRATPMLIFEDFIEWRLYHSYKTGHRKFVLNFGNYEPNKLHLDAVEDPATVVINGNSPKEWWSVLGKNSKNVTYVINGHVGRDIGSDSARCTFYANSDIDNCGEHSALGKFYVKGNVNQLGMRAGQSQFYVIGDVKRCGDGANNCLFSIKGKCETFGYCAEDCTFIFKDEIGYYFGEKSKNCRFIATDRGTYEMLKKNIPKGNKVILLK